MHLEHGVGIYRGIVQLFMRESTIEVAVIEYEGGDRLNVPLYRIDQIERYRSGVDVGDDAPPPRLHKLGGRRWAQQREKTRAAIEEMTQELLVLYARRQLASRPPHLPDTAWQRQVESSFLFEDTPDQRKATADVKGDMEKPRPMDRLLVGDVGYGKTEVAIRAAFKAIQSGRQVAVLVPTTILAEQHFRTFQADLPSEVPRPELLMPLLILGLVVLGLSMALRRTARQGARLLGWYVTVGALLTGFVEYVVLSGDIGRMNTVFKFYIHVWVLWSIGAGVALAAFLEWLVRRPNIEWRWLWRGTMAALVCCGLVYTVTAARAKIEDRFPADRSIPEADMAALHRPGLSGIDYMAHAAYIEYDEHSPQTPHLLELSADHEAIQWLLANVDGTPTREFGSTPAVTRNHHV